MLLHAATPEDRPFALVSGAGDPRLTEWSYAALEPYDRAATAHEAARLAGRLAPGSPFHPPFSGGAVGYLGYDAGFAQALGARLARRDPLDLAPSQFLLFDALYARNERTKEGFLLAQPTHEAEQRRERLHRALFAQPRAEAAGGLVGRLEPAIARAQHLARIGEALELIRAGEIYQVNLTYPLVGRYVGDPRAAFQRLLRGARPPFSAFLSPSPEAAIVSASPECFFTFDADSRLLSTYPIKGTRRRDPDPDRDAALARELAESVKDRAEHVMIVDLLRNDVGRAARIGSVAAEPRLYVESFSSVHHLTSRVTGEVLPGVGLDGLLDALFPGGSITGAPKLRSMEVIDALEDAPRGVYTGAIGWINPEGSAELSVAIRTASIAGGEVRFGVGGGIVADSVPELEWEETEVKARALREALVGAGSN